MLPCYAVNLDALLMQGDQRHLLLAHLFDKPCFLGLLAVKVVIIFLFFFIMIELPPSSYCQNFRYDELRAFILV